MVLGIDLGKIEITTEKQSYAPGEIIKGRLKLNLKSSLKARELTIEFRGQLGLPGKNKRNRIIHQQKFVLSGEREYPAGASVYNFDITTPAFRRFKYEGEGFIASAINFIGYMFDEIAHAKWYLGANLNVPMAFDIYNEIKINFVV